MSAHSAGPWQSNGRSVCDVDGRSIAAAHEWDTRPHDRFVRARQNAIVLANARLIAAAPEMFELLRRMACDCVCEEANGNARIDLRGMADALLARIDGETP
jgi:hypothetical protein